MKTRQEFDNSIGKEVSLFNNISEALQYAEIDYTVEKQPIYLEDGRQVIGNYANVRSDTNTPLSVVGERYTNLQNQDAFSFIQDLIDLYNLKLNKVGCFDEGRKVFITAMTEEPFYVLGEKYKNKMTFLNSFDGSGSVKVLYVPMREVCTNGLMLEDNRYRFQLSLQHSKSIKDKIESAKNVMRDNCDYISFIKGTVDHLASIRFTKKQYSAMVDKLMPIPKNASLLTEDRALTRRADVINAYNVKDLQNFNNTAYKAIMAVSDYESHYEPLRNTGNDYIYLQRVVTGMKLLNQVYNYIQQELKFKVHH